MEEQKRRTWAEVSLGRLEANYRALRDLIPHGCKFMGMVKSDAYSHGAVRVARKLEELGADYLGVACLDEALELRQSGITMPILILGYTAQGDVPLLIEENLAQTVFDLDQARAYSDQAQTLGKELVIHIKVDTGMSRLGFFCDECTQEDCFEAVKTAYVLPGLVPEGIFTHFAYSDGDEDYTMTQFVRFLGLLDKLEGAGCQFAIRHAANSGATILYPSTHLDMVRPGIALYGYYPGPDMEGLCPLTPVMEVKSRISSVKKIPAGTSVSYGRTCFLSEEKPIAVIPIGYGDGFFRGLGNRFWVTVSGERAPIVGRVCMDMCMADVSHISQVNIGDEALIYGGKPGTPQCVEEGARVMDTISYEMLCALSKRIPRLYL